MMVILGAHSQLGRNLIAKLNEENFNYLVLAEAQQQHSVLQENTRLRYWHLLEYSTLPRWVSENSEEIEFILWCTSEPSPVESSLFAELWHLCCRQQIPLLFTARDQRTEAWTQQQEAQPFFWAGLLVGTLYGSEKKPLFDITTHFDQSVLQQLPAENERLRHADQHFTPPFTYVQDVVEVLYFFIRNRRHAGCHVLPQQQTTWPAFRHIMKQAAETDAVPKPLPWSGTALAAMEKFRKIGFKHQFRSISEGIYDVAKNPSAAYRLNT